MLDTVGVLSILEAPLIHVVEDLWKRFEREFGCTAVRVFPHPNLTLQAGLTTDARALEEDIALWIMPIPQFEIFVQGAGVFDTPSPTIFLRVYASDTLRALNHDLARIFSGHCPNLMPHYQPATWIPHITLAMKDLMPEDLGRARDFLSGYNLEYRQIATNLTLVRRSSAGDTIEIVRRWSLLANDKQIRGSD